MVCIISKWFISKIISLSDYLLWYSHFVIGFAKGVYCIEDIMVICPIVNRGHLSEDWLPWRQKSTFSPLTKLHHIDVNNILMA